MFNYIRTANLLFTVNSYSCIVLGRRRSSLLGEKFVKFGNVILSSNLSQSSKLYKIIRKHNLSELKNIMHDLPKNIWKSKSDFIVTYSFAIHKKTAENIADTIMDSVCKKSKEPIVIELNPGFGLITKQLFDRGLKNLVVYDKCQLTPFNKILQEYTRNIKLLDVNAFDTKTDNTNMYYKLFHHVSDIKDNEIVIIGMSPNRLFFRRLMYFITNFSFSCCKNVEFYLTLPHRIYNCLTSLQDQNARVNDYGCFSVLFQMEVLKKYPREYFLPLSVEFNTAVYFVKLSRKDQILTKEDLILYTNFLKIIGSKKSNYVIGELEKWFPGSGPYFIAQGISPTNQTYELDAKGFLRLFNILRRLQGYEESLFLMKTYDSTFLHESK